MAFAWSLCQNLHFPFPSYLQDYVATWENIYNIMVIVKKEHIKIACKL